jgi:hypothetical protein
MQRMPRWIVRVPDPRGRVQVLGPLLVADKGGAREYVLQFYSSGSHMRRAVPRGTWFELTVESDSAADAGAPREIPLAPGVPVREWVRKTFDNARYSVTDRDTVWHRVFRQRGHRAAWLKTECSRHVPWYWEGVIALDPPGPVCARCGDRQYADSLDQPQPVLERRGVAPLLPR